MTFTNWKRGSDGDSYRYWNCFSPSLFEEFLLLQENLPYTPENELNDIRESVMSCVDPEEFDSRMGYWKDQAELYKNTGNIYEHDHILASMNVAFQEYNHKDSQLAKAIEVLKQK